MRFHIGFSKYFSISKLIKWLGMAFVGLVALLGFTKVNADTLVENFDLTNYISNSGGFAYYNNNNGTITDGFANVLPIVAYCSQSANRNSSYCRSYQQSPYNNYYPMTSNYDNLFYPLLSVRNGSYNINSYKQSYIVVNHSFCDTETNNSIDFFFDYQSEKLSYYNNLLQNQYFNNHFGSLTTLGDLYFFGIEPMYQDGGPTQTWPCSILYDSNNENGSFIYDSVMCYGVPVGTTSNPVVSYNIYVGNKYAYNLEPQQLVYSGTGTKDIYPEFNIKRIIDYQCSYVEPNDPNEPIFPNDARGESHIDYDSISNDGSSASVNITNTDLYVSWIDELDIPQSLLNLIQTPARIVNIILNNNDACQPLSLNMSSITRRFGGYDYSIQVPCMRATLSRLLNYEMLPNITIYELVDLFTATSLLITLSFKTYHIIMDMISGEDLSKELDM